MMIGHFVQFKLNQCCVFSHFSGTFSLSFRRHLTTGCNGRESSGGCRRPSPLGNGKEMVNRKKEKGEMEKWLQTKTVEEKRMIWQGKVSKKRSDFNLEIKNQSRRFRSSHFFDTFQDNQDIFSPPKSRIFSSELFRSLSLTSIICCEYRLLSFLLALGPPDGHWSGPERTIDNRRGGEKREGDLFYEDGGHYGGENREGEARRGSTGQRPLRGRRGERCFGIYLHGFLNAFLTRKERDFSPKICPINGIYLMKVCKFLA